MAYVVEPGGDLIFSEHVFAMEQALALQIPQAITGPHNLSLSCVCVFVCVICVFVCVCVCCLCVCVRSFW